MACGPRLPCSTSVFQEFQLSCASSGHTRPLRLLHPYGNIMKVASGSAAAAAGPSCSLKAGKTAGGAGEVVRCLSEQSVAISRCAGGAGARLPALLDEPQVNVLLYDMNGCYSRLKELVPTLPQNRKVSKVEILQHVIDYIWDLESELRSESQVGAPGGRGLPARAPLSTLNGEISALAAEVRFELSTRSSFFPKQGN
ncbi:DNA-binding protein inhibitor ID-1 [Galemys pyrenaicus]|uniref:DNA-binding protein inhibitor ID-3 n=1 Tax=Galemys pyrenaicus TaxID=202257 RepID=A0A8J6AT34_GALPY|nr:DNA-binding protein inhibitor ID-1 [Galemys pyrenaicus]